MPQEEILPQTPWDVPPAKWERYLSLPPLPKVTGPPEDWAR
jgi:hypothetical protein